MSQSRCLIVPHLLLWLGYGLTVTFTTSVQSPFGVPLSQKRMRYSRTSGVPAASSGRSSM
jgi:hypothetical protein